MLIRARVHPFPSRTRKLSSLLTTILGWRRPGKIGSANTERSHSFEWLLFIFTAGVTAARKASASERKTCMGEIGDCPICGAECRFSEVRSAENFMEKDGLIFHDENSWRIQFPLYSQQIGQKENAFRCLQRSRVHAKAPRCGDFHSKIPFFDRKTRIPLPLLESCAMLKNS